jgi:hypothetical protein
MVKTCGLCWYLLTPPLPSLGRSLKYNAHHPSGYLPYGPAWRLPQNFLKHRVHIHWGKGNETLKKSIEPWPSQWVTSHFVSYLLPQRHSNVRYKAKQLGSKESPLGKKQSRGSSWKKPLEFDSCEWGDSWDFHGRGVLAET